MKALLKISLINIGIVLLIASCKKEETHTGNATPFVPPGSTQLTYDTTITVDYVIEAMGQMPYSILQISGAIIGANAYDQTEAIQNSIPLNLYSPPASSQQHVANICATNNIVLTKTFKLSKVNGTQMHILLGGSGIAQVTKTTQITFTNNNWHFSNNTDFKYDLNCKAGKWIVYFKAN